MTHATKRSAVIVLIVVLTALAGACSQVPDDEAPEATTGARWNEATWDQDRWN